MDSGPQQLSLSNICGGAVEEVFARELKEILENISDVNTDAEKVRSLTIEFKFSPFHDRSGAEVEFHCKSKVAPTEAVKGNVFFSKQTGTLKAYARDPRQTALFAQQPAEGRA